MTRRVLAAVCCVLVSVASMVAQSRGAKADPLSGTWKGELNVPAAPDPVAITMELTFEGSKVSGTFTGLPNPGDVKVGTFNPETGALKLHLGKKDESRVIYTFLLNSGRGFRLQRNQMILIIQNLL